MDPHTIAKLAKEAGLVQGPWSNVENQRIWQENRDFPDALEVFASLVIKECISKIKQEINEQNGQGITSNFGGLNQAIFILQEIEQKIEKNV